MKSSHKLTQFMLLSVPTTTTLRPPTPAPTPPPGKTLHFVPQFKVGVTYTEILHRFIDGLFQDHYFKVSRWIMTPWTTYYLWRGQVKTLTTLGTWPSRTELSGSETAGTSTWPSRARGEEKKPVTLSVTIHDFVLCQYVIVFFFSMPFTHQGCREVWVDQCAGIEAVQTVQCQGRYRSV